jgi:hypothetical protein
VKTKPLGPAVTPGADPDEYWRREREIGAKARSGKATIEDYIALGYTEAGALWIVDPALAESWADEWYTCGTTAGRARRLPGRRLPSRPFLHSPSVAKPPLTSGLLCNDREPYAPWFGVDGENPNDADRRWHLMVTFAEEAILNLAHDIKAGAVPLVKRAYRRNRRGETELDITRCVIGREAMLDFAKRIGRYGSKIAELLATSDRQRKPEPKERVRPTPAGLDQWMREYFRKGNKREPDHQACVADTGAGWRDAVKA